MTADVVLLPPDLSVAHLNDRAVVLFDVLRATTTMTAALAIGVTSIGIFASTADVRTQKQSAPNALACGEEACLRPPDFDLGNSPAAISDFRYAGRRLLMSTTNGTRAILAAQSAPRIFVGALINAKAVADVLAREDRDVTLLCAGTDGEASLEDLLGAGAVLESLRDLKEISAGSDTVLIAEQLFTAARGNLASALRATRGGQNILRAGLPEDITFAAQLNSVNVVGIAKGHPPVVTRHAANP